MLMQRADVPSSEITPSDLYLRRREFVAMLAAAIAASMGQLAARLA